MNPSLQNLKNALTKKVQSLSVPDGLSPEDRSYLLSWATSEQNGISRAFVLSPEEAEKVISEAETHVRSIDMRSSSNSAMGTVYVKISGDKTFPVSSVFTKNWTRPHDDTSRPGAVDFNGPNMYAKPVVAFMAGIATSHPNNGNGKGKWVEVDHGNGIVSEYFHLSAFCGTLNKTPVKVGEQIGYVGHSGYVEGPTGTHLHFEVNQYSKGVKTQLDAREVLKGASQW